MWASVQKEPPPREPDYNSIEQLFCLPVAEPKDKGAAAPVKKEPKEVRRVNAAPSCVTRKTHRGNNTTCFICSLVLDHIHRSKEEPESEYFPEAV